MASDKMSQQQEVMSLTEVAAGLGSSWKTVWRLVQREEIKAHRVGGQWRVTREEYGRLIGRPVGNEEAVKA